MREKELCVAVIDDGINEKLFSIPELVHNLEVTESLEIRARAEYNPYTASHGTTCAAIISKYASNLRLSSIKILNYKRLAVREQLIHAINWCINNDIKIINLSLGSIQYRDFASLKEVINSAYANGVIIIAACNNTGVFTYPASHSNIIGVKCDRSSTLKEGEFFYNYYAFDGIEITACGEHSLTLFTGETKWTGASNSFAAPLITATVANILAETNTEFCIEELKEKLRVMAKNKYIKNYKHYIRKNLDWLGDSDLFILGRNDNLVIPSKIKTITQIDCKNEQLGLETIKVLHEQRKLDSDSLIVCVDTCLDKAEEIELCEFFQFVNKLRKNIVYLNDKSKTDDIFLTNVSFEFKLWHPSNYKYFMPCIESSRIDIPIIAFYNYTNNSHNKAIGQLLGLFRENGYNAIAVSNKCDGILSGIEYMDLIDFSCKGLEFINKIYNPDLILLWISLNAENSILDIINQVETNYDTDIRITIKNEKDYNFVAISNQNNEFVLFLNDDLPDDREKQDIYITKIDNKKSIESIFKKIIRIYESM